jgi:hypothetical protein
VPDHTTHIRKLRLRARPDTTPDLTDDELADHVAADLLEAHDLGDLSLDNWVAAREFVERRADIIVAVNGG